ncbi:MAG: LamG domain-containing protein, partial [Anaerolineales bacterium]|nr:LamG domain-containing protein [Anaerolineales bacterium]
VLNVATSDPSSRVVLLDYGLKGPGASAFTWRGTAECTDSNRPGTVWCPEFDSTTLGEGVYEVQFRAVDMVGNETTSPVHQFIVDGSAPVASSGLNNTLLPASQIGDNLAWIIFMLGNISEPQVAGQPGSGLLTDQIFVELRNEAGEVLDENPQLAVYNADTWQLSYRTEGERPLGTYEVWVTAVDAVGNRSETNVGTIVVDAQPSQATPNLWELPASGGIISGSLAISGTVTDIPVWGGTLGQYHLETLDFYDSSPAQAHGSCTNCPVLTNGIAGNGLSFDGADDTVLLPSLFNPISDTFSLSLWFNASSSGSGSRVMAQQDDPNGRNLLALTPENNLRTYLGGHPTIGSTVVVSDSWQHAALTWDGTAVRLYLNGQLEVEQYIIAEFSDGALMLGSNRGTGAFFLGQLDEVTFYSDVLSPYEVYNLAQTEGQGVQSVEVGFELVDFTALSETIPAPPTSGATVWVPASVSNANSLLSSWTINENQPLENYYTVKLRSTDAEGNRSGEGVIWRGLIDRVA